MPGPTLAHRTRIAANPAQVAAARSEIDALLRTQGWSDEARHRVVLATGEALANAMEHGSDAGDKVTIEAELGHEKATIHVRDAGRGPLPRLDREPPPCESPRGRGLVIMRTLSDYAEIRRGGGGTEVVLHFAQA